MHELSFPFCVRQGAWGGWIPTKQIQTTRNELWTSRSMCYVLGEKKRVIELVIFD